MPHSQISPFSMRWHIPMCSMPHSHMIESCHTNEWERVTRSHSWRHLFIRVTWRMHMCVVTLSGQRRNPLCSMPHSQVWAESLKRVTWLIDVCDITSILQGQIVFDSFVGLIFGFLEPYELLHVQTLQDFMEHVTNAYVSWLIRMCDMSNRWHEVTIHSCELFMLGGRWDQFSIFLSRSQQHRTHTHIHTRKRGREKRKNQHPTPCCSRHANICITPSTHNLSRAETHAHTHTHTNIHTHTHTHTHKHTQPCKHTHHNEYTQSV